MSNEGNLDMEQDPTISPQELPTMSPHEQLPGKSSPKQPVDEALAACLSLLLGFVFGLMMERSFVFAPISIRGQFIMERFLMLKVPLNPPSSTEFISSQPIPPRLKLLLPHRI